MERPPITRVWGKADGFDIEFTHKEGAEWLCSVLPDTADGQYAVEIWALNSVGLTDFWSGFLYMCNGLCHLEIHASPYRIHIKPTEERIRINKGTTRMIISKGCSLNFASEAYMNMVIGKGRSG